MTIVKLSFQDRVDMDQPPLFKRMFMALKGLVDSFRNSCRPFFCLDGCHLTGPSKGTLLAATITLDANKGIFPIAWYIADGETTESWTWFMDCLHLCIHDNKHGVPNTIISYKQKVNNPYNNVMFCLILTFTNLELFVLC